MTPQLPAIVDNPAAWQIMRDQGEMAVKSGLLPKAINTPEAAIIVMLKGRELGLPPMQALNSIVVIQGKPTISAEGMAALIFRDHGDNALRFTETSATKATVRYQRKSWKEPQEFSFTMEDAKRAGVTNNPTWNKYPAAMLRARCISAVARLAFPDTIGGLYTPEELGGEPAEDDLVILTPASEPQDTPLAEAIEAETATPTNEAPAEIITEWDHAVATSEQVDPDQFSHDWPLYLKPWKGALGITTLKQAVEAGKLCEQIHQIGDEPELVAATYALYQLVEGSNLIVSEEQVNDTLLKIEQLKSVSDAQREMLSDVAKLMLDY